MTTDKKTSILIPRQLPQYIRQDHPGFVEFMAAYYEWMEQTGNTLDFSKNLLAYQDVDTTIDLFIKHFKAQFLASLPETLYVDPGDPNTKVDKIKLLKNIKQFYQAKGTEKSYQFLFRILFNTEIEFYYPRVDILKPSDGKWYQDITIRVRQLTGNPFLWKNNKIRGATSNATALVENVQKIFVGPLEVYEIFLNRSSIVGAFLPEENITADSIVGTTGETYSLLTGITITDPGEGYSIGDVITISQVGPGFGAQAAVTNVGDLGEVLKIKILDYGAGYSSGILDSEIDFPVQAQQATGSAIIGAQTLYPGYFLNDDGKLSNAKYIQDSYYYQQFSYVIKVNESIDTYRTIVKEFIHPAGLQMFGSFLTESAVNGSAKLPLSAGCAFITIGHHYGYAPYGFNEEPPVIPDDYFIQDYVVQCKSSLAASLITLNPVMDQKTLGEGSHYKLGSSNRSIERDKFTYLPTEGSVDQTVFGYANAGYFDTHANYQLEHFDNFKLYWFEGNNNFFTLELGAGVGIYSEDELVYQGLNTTHNSFKGEVMGYNDDGTIVIKVLSGAISLNKPLKGNTSLSSYALTRLVLSEHGLAAKTNITPESVLKTSA